MYLHAQEVHQSSIKKPIQLRTNLRHLGQPCQAVVVAVAHRDLETSAVLAAVAALQTLAAAEVQLVEVAGEVLVLQAILSEEATLDHLQ